MKLIGVRLPFFRSAIRRMSHGFAGVSAVDGSEIASLVSEPDAVKGVDAVQNRLSGLGVSRAARVLMKVVRAKTLVAARAALAHREVEGPEDRMPAVFQPELMLPVQFYDLLRRKHELDGEKLLMFAVLEDGVENYMKHLNTLTRKGQNRFHEAEEWIEREDKQWLFSFDNICEALDIDSDYMRQGLRRWAQLHRQKVEVQPAASA